MVTHDGLRFPSSKVMTLEQVAIWRRSVRGEVVFTNGVFDLLHPGHVDVLDRARREGAALVVGVNSDASVKRLKGTTRPIRTSVERIAVLAGLEAVEVRLQITPQRCLVHRGFLEIEHEDVVNPHE